MSRAWPQMTIWSNDSNHGSGRWSTPSPRPSVKSCSTFGRVRRRYAPVKRRLNRPRQLRFATRTISHCHRLIRASRACICPFIGKYWNFSPFFSRSFFSKVRRPFWRRNYRWRSRRSRLVLCKERKELYYILLLVTHAVCQTPPHVSHWFCPNKNKVSPTNYCLNCQKLRELNKNVE